MIVKLQRPIYHSGPGPAEALIYDRRRRYEVMVPMTQEIFDLLEGDLKGYFSARVVDGKIALGNRVKDQNW